MVLENSQQQQNYETNSDLDFVFPLLFFLGSIYEPLKSINLPKPEGESLWDKLDHYYRIGKLIIVPTMRDFQCNLPKYLR